MDIVKMPSKSPRSFCLDLVLCTLLGSALWAQAPAQRVTASQGVPSSAREGAASTQTPPLSQERTISPEEATELFKSVDEILEYASQDTKLPIKAVVKRRL